MTKKLIYLEDALDALAEESYHNEEDYRTAVKAIGGLPSAQTEIIRCKDCKHYGCILYSGTQFEYGECFGHEESDYTFEVKPDDFCSRAERRTDDR